MLFPHLLQAATQQVNVAPPSGSMLSLGAWLGIIVAGAGLVGGVYKLGANDANTKNVKSTVEGTLLEVSKKLDEFTAFIQDTMEERVRVADFKGNITGRVGTMEVQTEDNKKNVSTARNVAAEAYALAEKVDARTQAIEERVRRIETDRDEERRHGPSDRRQHES